MKRISLTICAAAFLFAACNNEKKTDEETTTKSSDTATKTEEKKPETYTMPDSATMMKNWQAYMTPGKEHEMLAKSDGKWSSEVTWWESPGAPAQKSTGTMVNKMVLGGRYQVSNHTGNMMGMPFEGMSTTAFDNAKKVFISTWIDNMGTGLMTAEGPWDEATKSITMKGKAVDPITGKEMDIKEIFKIIDDNTQTMEMYDPAPDGTEYKTMEITYKRKK